MLSLLDKLTAALFLTLFLLRHTKTSLLVNELKIHRVCAMKRYSISAANQGSQDPALEHNL